MELPLKECTMEPCDIVHAGSCGCKIIVNPGINSSGPIVKETILCEGCKRRRLIQERDTEFIGLPKKITPFPRWL